MFTRIFGAQRAKHSIRLRSALALGLTLWLSPYANAVEIDYLPAELQPWVDWVLQKHPELNCPSKASAVGRAGCVWVSSSSLNVGVGGMDFDLRAQMFAPGLLLLPGDANSWPLQVSANDGQVPVVRAGQHPALQLAPGRYRVRGSIPFARRPDSVMLPSQFGLLSLRMNDQIVHRPTVRDGRLFFGERSQPGKAEQPESLQVEVFRQLTDDVPLRLLTHVRVRVAGPSRIETLGRVLLPNFAPTGVDSPLPARLLANGNLQIQVEAGEHLLTVGARALQTIDSLAMDAQSDSWPAQEVWAFQPRRELRLVQLTGAPGVDLGQVNAPFRVDGLQGYLLSGSDSLAFIEQQRGDPNPTPGEITLHRELWLNFDGSGYVIQDQVQAQLRRAARLSSDYSLGSVAVNGTNQLVTKLADGEPGIELSAGPHHVTAVSAVSRNEMHSAIGWNLNAASLSATLHLPPGYRLLWARGIDAAPTSWLASWTLWDLFVVILTLVLSWRYFGRGFTALIALALLVAYQEGAALAIAWLGLLSLFVLLRHIDHERLAGLLRLLASAIAFVAVLGALGIAIDHARQGLHQQLSRQGYTAYQGGAQMGAPQGPVTMTGIASPETELEERMSADSSAMVKEKTVRRRKSSRQEYPEGLQVQTGPGVPAWTWDRASLVWHGPVVAGQPLDLTLMPPFMVRIWHWLIAVAVLLVTGLLLLPLLGQLPKLPAWLRRLSPQVGVLAVSFGLWVPAHELQAAAIDPEILKELEQRLLQAPPCEPGCASIGTVQVNLTEENLELVLEVHSATFVAVPIPGSISGWSPSLIEVDGATATVTGGASTDAKPTALTVALQPGVHEVRLQGTLLQLDQAELRFPLPPAMVEVNNRSSWRVQGLRNQRLVRRSLTLERDRSAGDSSAATARKQTLHSEAAPAYVRVERSLDFGLDWRVDTRVTRVAPKQGSFSVSIPILAGEAVLTESINVVGDTAKLVFGAGQGSIAWRSTLARAQTVALAAPEISKLQEVWSFQSSNLWHLHYQPSEGLVASSIAGRSGPVFYPRGAERLQVRPEATQPIPGASVTVHAVAMNLTPGERIQTSNVQLQIQASQGGDYTLKLPQGAELTGVHINDQQQPIGLREGRVDIPLVTGRANYRIGWRRPLEQSLLYRTEAVQVPGALSNVTLAVQFPRDRWVLALGGPRLGPAILFWGVLVVVALVGLLVSRVPNMPFRASDALLLALGLTLCNFPTAVLVVLWVLALRARAEWIEHIKHRWILNLVQLALAAFSIVAVSALVYSVPLALLGSPDMQIVGNGSSAYFYQWFADHTMLQLPNAWVFSLPLWVYRLAMLGWSLWLAFALIRWLRWAWSAWSTPQVWYGKQEEPVDEALS
ncbi:MAG: hypothetical protein ACR2PZ_11020 [Pseudomonadales bacterium]